MPEKPILYRKRLIPNECIRLEKDEVLLQEESLLVTKWTTIRPKKELSHGISCFLLDKGWKISQFMNHDNQLICWYCDIIEHNYDPETNTYVFTDLLADVLIYPSGKIKVVDLDEIADAYEQGLLSADQACACMRKLDALLREVYAERLLPDLEQYWRL